MLKGRVVSVVWSNGKKHRSYVKGIGNQTAVQSAYASETAQLNELVLFEFSDPSGMSYRTTDKLGAAAATGDGGEGSPIETDPLGGSIGTFTPFLLSGGGGDYQPYYPELDEWGTPDMPTPNFTSLYSHFGSRISDLPGFGTNWGSFAELGMQMYGERVRNSWYGAGFRTSEELGGRPGATLTGFGLRYGNGTEVGGNWTRDQALDEMEGGEGLTLNWEEGGEDWNTSSTDPGNSFTYYQLIYEHGGVRKFMNDAWDRTVRSAEEVSKNRTKWQGYHSGAEHGGAITGDFKSMTLDYWQYTGTRPPLFGQSAEIANASDQIRGFLEQIRKGGGAGHVVLTVHTHPPSGPALRSGPYANQAQLEALYTWHSDAVTSHSPNPSTFDHLNLIGRFGVVVHGRDRFTVYGRGASDVETLKRTCVR